MRGRLRAQWHELFERVRSEKLGEVAEEFDRTHSVYRAQQVGSLHQVLPAHRIRPYLIEAVERGVARAENRDSEHATEAGDATDRTRGGPTEQRR